MLEKRKPGPYRFISTRNWSPGKFYWTFNGYGAWYKKRGRPPLPYGMRLARQKDRDAKRRKTSRRNKKRLKETTIPPIKGERPTNYEWEQKRRQREAARKIKPNHWHGTAIQKAVDILKDLVDGDATSLGEAVGEEVRKYITQDAFPDLFNWFLKACKQTKPKKNNGRKPLNFPELDIYLP